MTDPKNVDMGAKIELAGLVLQLCFFQCLRASPSTSIAAASAMDLPNSRAHVRCWLPVCLHGPTDCAQHILFSGVCAGIQWWVSPLEILRGRAPAKRYPGDRLVGLTDAHPSSKGCGTKSNMWPAGFMSFKWKSGDVNDDDFNMCDGRLHTWVMLSREELSWWPTD